MSKIAILADIHIDDYQKYNVTPGSRLNQFITYGCIVNDYCRELGIDTIILAGDTLNKAVTTPQVLHTLHDFLRLISSNGKRNVLHICGQHDYNCKVSRADFRSTDMNLFSEYTTYVGDGRIMKFGEIEVATRDWVPGDEADTSFIDHKVDLFIGHVTNIPRFGQKIDESKFDLAIVGDIHQQSRYGKVINLGTPFYHHSIDECQDGRIAVIDCDTPGLNIENRVSFVQVDPSGEEFVKVVKTNTPVYAETKYDETTNTFYEYYPPLESQFSVEGSGITSKSISESDVMKLITSEIEKIPELVEVHKSVLPKINTEGNRIDLNFKLISVEIQNYRSIEHYKYDFTRTTAVIGSIGSGKSSFIEAIRTALSCGKIPEKRVSHWADYSEINLVVEYNGINYTLCSSTGPFAFAINGEWSTVSARDRVELARKTLPFLNYTDLFIFTVEDAQLLGALNEDRKSEILSKMYNINILNDLNEVAATEHSELKIKFNSLSSDKVRLEGELNSYQSMISELTIDEINSQIVELNKSKESTSKLLTEVTEATSLIEKRNTLTNSITSNQYNLDKAVESRDLLESDYKVASANIDTYKGYLTEKSTYDQLKKQVESMQNICTSEYNELLDMTKKYESDLIALGDAVCPNCHQKLTPESIVQHKAELTDKYNSAYNTKMLNYNTHLSEYNELVSKFQSLPNKSIDEVQITAEIQKYNKCITEYNAYSTQVRTYEGMIKSDKQRLSSLGEVKLSTDESISDLTNKLVHINSQLDSLQKEVTLRLKSDKITESLAKANELLTELESKIESYQKYLNLTSNTSDLYKSILLMIADRFSNNTYKLTVDTFLYRGKMKLSISMKYKNGEYYEDYSECSTGQKCFCDVYFLSKLLTGAGALIMDEYFKNIPSDSMLEMTEILKKMNTNSLVFSSHHDNLIVDGEVLKFELIDNKTKITKL